jgi:hypothetical protein
LTSNSLPADRDNLLRRLEESSEVRITVLGRKTKREFSTPGWFVLSKEKVMLVPMKGSDTDWFKNLEKDPHIKLGVDGIVIESRATILRESNQVEKVLDKFRIKYKSMWSESYYTKRDAYVEVTV